MTHYLYTRAFSTFISIFIELKTNTFTDNKIFSSNKLCCELCDMFEQGMLNVDVMDWFGLWTKDPAPCNIRSWWPGSGELSSLLADVI